MYSDFSLVFTFISTKLVIQSNELENPILSLSPLRNVLSIVEFLIKHFARKFQSLLSEEEIFAFDLKNL